MGLKERYKESFSFIFEKENKKAIYLSIGIFVFSFLVGILRPEWFAAYQKKIISDLMAVTNGRFFGIVYTIIWTNIKAAFLGMFLGILFIPTFVLSLLNGYIFGAVTSRALAGFGLGQVLLRVLPHGIFEIPVAILSYAFGFILALSLFKRVKRKKGKEIKGKETSFFELYKKAVFLFLFFIIPLLILAGIIEGVLVRYIGLFLKLNLQNLIFCLVILYLFYSVVRLLRTYKEKHDPKLIAVLCFALFAAIIFWMEAYGLRVMELLETSAVLKLFLIATPFAIFLFYLFLENLRYKEEKQKLQLKGAFQQYVSPSVINEIMKHPEKLKLGGEKKELTIFFSDIRDFSTIAERFTPEQLVRILNEYLSSMTDIILKNRGVIDKYRGDEIMAFWNAPLDEPEHAKLACNACLEMKEALKKLQEDWDKEGISKINIGIGLNTGEAVVGNMGSSHRFDYTAIGDSVNLASRLEELNKVYGAMIIISESTYEKIKDEFECRELDFVRVKGKKKPVRIYELVCKKNQLNKKDKQFITLFETALQSYRSRKWDAAITGFKKCLSIKDDKVAAFFIERCQEFKKLPKKKQPSKSWDGIYELKTK